MNITVTGFQVVVTKNQKVYLEKRCEKTAKPGEWIEGSPYYWKRIGNYSNIESALRGLLDQKLKASDASDIKMLLQGIKQAQQEIEKAIRKARVLQNVMAGKRVQSGTQAFL